MKVKFERFLNNEWIAEECDTDNLENDSGDEWTEDMLINYLKDTEINGRIRKIET
ncbi:MAG: hypothetical protein GY853_09915 [PVC group bacterium]|nr:hypothetical protein [PVC group bacterium]